MVVLQLPLQQPQLPRSKQKWIPAQQVLTPSPNFLLLVELQLPLLQPLLPSHKRRMKQAPNQSPILLLVVELLPQQQLL